MTNLNDALSDEYYEHPREDIQLTLQNYYKDHAVSEPKSVVDVGCASGVFLSELKKTFNFARTCGIEPTEKAELAATRVDKVWNRYFTPELAEEMNEDFDLIVLNDCFEHIYDSGETLAAIKKIAHDDTLISFSIPNLRYISNLWHILGKRDFQYEDAGIRDRTHVRFFTKKSFISLLEANGFQILESNVDLFALNRGLLSNRSLKGRIFSLVRPLLRLVLWRHKDILEPQFMIIASSRN